jgi:tetratricopeptide (TPR) repeat protein
MRTLAVALLGLLVLAGAACQSPTAPPPAHVELDAAGRAAAALEAGRYAEAVGLFREALAPAPANVALRYGLAVALSYTDRGAAIREFQWVMASAPRDSQERVESQAWLARAGALPASPPPPRPGEPEGQAGTAVLRGRAIFADGSAKPMGRLQLFLVGQPDSPTKAERYNLRTDENGDFKFPNVPPGPYMLTNRLAGQPIWRLRVELKAAEEKQLDLNSGNSVTVRDDFPGR